MLQTVAFRTLPFSFHMRYASSTPSLNRSGTEAEQRRNVPAATPDSGEVPIAGVPGCSVSLPLSQPIAWASHMSVGYGRILSLHKQ